MERTQGSDSAETQADSIVFDHVTVKQPAGVHPLTLRIDRGQHTLVVAPTSHHRHLIRLLVGTDQAQQGVLRVPSGAGEIACVTRTPYIKPHSALWDQLVFPHAKAQSLARNLLDACEHDWGRACDWARVLSAHGLTALAVARMLYLAPKFAVVEDQALGVLGEEAVGRLAEVSGQHHVTLIILAAPGSHAYQPLRGALARVLEIHDDGSWRFSGVGGEHRAFDVDEPKRAVWGEMSGQLVRRASTLSQCSTTERRWLLTPEVHASPGRQSPALTSRSSVSDISGDLARLSVSERVVVAVVAEMRAPEEEQQDRTEVSGIPRPGQKEPDSDPQRGHRQYARTPRSYARPGSRTERAAPSRPFSRADGESPEVVQESAFAQALYASPTRIPRPSARRQADSASISSVSSSASSTRPTAMAPRVYVAKSAIRADDMLALH
ncbi:hypothetical protein DL89DRAFT_291143 [Linderina pennispora]|uniref:ABC transporter domain-containing protein n=1 Tax=Linderina pennispora TaxID=61395 RepID=A0A1Y1WEA5_9FUNG|nr:uncharacterized protein DL89DRAFT_291143 [Linderina pennispora]ORX71859.1 hypothetical protein DL89DRAFT_291143 [Linderina pennispora]